MLSSACRTNLFTSSNIAGTLGYYCTFGVFLAQQLICRRAASRPVLGGDTITVLLLFPNVVVAARAWSFLVGLSEGRVSISLFGRRRNRSQFLGLSVIRHRCS